MNVKEFYNSLDEDSRRKIALCKTVGEVEALLGTVELNLDQLDGVSGGYPPLVRNDTKSLGVRRVQDGRILLGDTSGPGAVNLRDLSAALLKEVQTLGLYTIP